MEKDLLEVERVHLSNVLKEIGEEKALDLEQTFGIVYTYDALGIEGTNRIPFEDVKRLLHNKALIGYSEREQKEILNHFKAFMFVKDDANAHHHLDEEKIKDIHEIVVDGIMQGGVYRNVNVQFYDQTHQPPDYVKVYDRMSKHVKAIQEFSGSAIEKAVFAHAGVAKIHPFLDGNSRVALLVMNHILIENGYLPISIPLVQKEAYRAHLETFKVEKDIAPLTHMIRSLLVSRYEEVLKALEVSA
jgi:Fic family protein